MCANRIVVRKPVTDRGDRYRLLAVAEPDETKAAVLRRLADEADNNEALLSAAMFVLITILRLLP